MSVSPAGDCLYLPIPSAAVAPPSLGLRKTEAAGLLNVNQWLRWLGATKNA